MSDLHDLSLSEITTRLRDGRLKAAELAEHAIARHERYGKPLNAYKHWAPADARRAAAAADAAFTAGNDLGPLQGVPVSVKDLFGVAGMPIFGGSPRPLPKRFEAEGPVVTALRRQAAVFTGKTHTVEFAYDGLGVNPHWGAPRNPWDAKAHRLPGGSSSGAGVSLLEGSAWVALGSDSGGSVRMPASWTGTVGFKISHGRWSIDGIVPFSPSLDSPGPLTRSVTDVAVAFAAIDPHVDRARLSRALEHATAADFRIGIPDLYFWDHCAPGVAEGIKCALDELRRAGARIEKRDLPEASEALGAAITRGNVVGVEFLASMRAELPEWLETLNPILAGRLAGPDDAANVAASDYFLGLKALKHLSAAAQARFANVDVLACPTIVSSPPTEGEVAALDAYLPHNWRMHQNTYPINLLGLCALTMPVALDKAGIPVGLQLIAKHGDDERLLTAAYAFEKVLGNGRQRLGVPPLCR